MATDIFSGDRRIPERSISITEEDSILKDYRDIDKSEKQEERNDKQEIYSSYPSNFMIPKGVCERNEPVLTIDNNKNK